MSENGNVTDAGVAHLKKLSKLKYLKLENLPGVKNPKNVFERIKGDLPNCEIIYTDYSSAGEKS